MNNILRSLGFILIILLIAAGVFASGFLTSKFLSSKGQSTTSSGSIKRVPNDGKPNSIFSSENASIQGKVTGVKGDKIDVQNNNGLSGSFILGQDFLIYKDLPGRMATPSSDLKLIELNKESRIGLSAINGQFHVTSIHY